MTNGDPDIPIEIVRAPPWADAVIAFLKSLAPEERAAILEEFCCVCYRPIDDPECTHEG